MIKSDDLRTGSNPHKRNPPNAFLVTIIIYLKQRVYFQFKNVLIGVETDYQLFFLIKHKKVHVEHLICIIIDI